MSQTPAAATIAVTIRMIRHQSIEAPKPIASDPPTGTATYRSSLPKSRVTACLSTIARPQVPSIDLAGSS